MVSDGRPRQSGASVSPSACVSLPFPALSSRQLFRRLGRDSIGQMRRVCEGRLAEQGFGLQPEGREQIFPLVCPSKVLVMLPVTALLDFPANTAAAKSGCAPGAPISCELSAIHLY